MRWFALCACALAIVGIEGCAATANPGYPDAYVAGPETSYAYRYEPYGYYGGYYPYGSYCCGLGLTFTDRFHHSNFHHFHHFNHFHGHGGFHGGFHGHAGFHGGFHGGHR